MGSTIIENKTESAVNSTEAISWLAADKEYALGIERGKLVCRNPKGKKLATVPKWLKETDLAEQLLATCEWLAEHRNECLQRVESWMLRSLPLPREVILELWNDPDWQFTLRNMVVKPTDVKGNSDDSQTGILRDVNSNKGIGVVDRDGESQWLKAAQILIPHPILIDGLDDLREIVSDLEFKQPLEQLYRPVFTVAEKQKTKNSILEFQDGKFEQLNFVISLCRRLGCPVRGGYASMKIWENSTPVDARYWVGAEHPEGETYTGELIFVDSEQNPIEIGSVGPVTFSEGMRMASQIFAKRVVEKERGDEDE